MLKAPLSWFLDRTSTPIVSFLYGGVAPTCSMERGSMLVTQSQGLGLTVFPSMITVQPSLMDFQLWAGPSLVTGVQRVASFFSLNGVSIRAVPVFKQKRLVCFVPKMGSWATVPPHGALFKLVRIFTSTRVAAQSTFILWLQPAALVQRVQFLMQPPLTCSFDGGSVAQHPHLPLAYSTSTTLARALGYSRRHRRLFFIQQCLFRYVRRCLIILNPVELGIWLLGVMPRFKVFWRLLTQPLNELFLHPLTGLPCLDVGWTSRQLGLQQPTLASLSSLLATATTVTSASQTQDGVPPLLYQKEIESFATQVQLCWGLGLAWQRYKLSWEYLYVFPKSAHGFIKTKAARSLKKRRTKQLVAKTKHRFWPH